MGDVQCAIQQSVVDGQQSTVQDEHLGGVFGTQEIVIGSNGVRPSSPVSRSRLSNTPLLQHSSFAPEEKK
jgi:hypothetical protein